MEGAFAPSVLFLGFCLSNKIVENGFLLNDIMTSLSIGSSFIEFIKYQIKVLFSAVLLRVNSIFDCARSVLNSFKEGTLIDFCVSNFDFNNFNSWISDEIFSRLLVNSFNVNVFTAPIFEIA